MKVLDFKPDPARPDNKSNNSTSLKILLRAIEYKKIQVDFTSFIQETQEKHSFIRMKKIDC